MARYTKSLQARLKTNTLRSASDEIKDIYCEPCHKDGIQAKAEGYCVDCPEYLCRQCYKGHRRFKLSEKHVLRFKLSEKHVLQNINSLPVTSYLDKKAFQICEEKCIIHPSKVTEYFCEDCELLGCTVCVTLNHRHCKKVKYIPDIANDFENSKEFEYFNEDLKFYGDRLSECEYRVSSSDSIMSQMGNVARRELKKQRAKVNKFFDQLEKEMEDKIAIIEERNIDTLKAATGNLVALQDDFEQINNDIAAKKKGNCELFIAMKRGKQKMKNFGNLFNVVLDERRKQPLTLFPSEQIEDMMRNTSEICRLETAVFEHEIDIHTDSDKNMTHIFGLTTVRNGSYCVAVDNGNKCVKVIDIFYGVTDKLDVNAHCLMGVTKVDDENVVLSVILPNFSNQIQIFSVFGCGMINLKEQHDTNFCYHDLLYCNNNLYAPINEEVHVLNMTGQIVFVIKDIDCNDLRGIAIGLDRQTLYVTDHNSVKSMTLDGKVKAVFYNTSEEFEGIAIDNKGHVYIKTCTCIHQFTGDLKKVHEIDVIGTCITYSSTENKLYTGNGKFISEFTLEEEYSTLEEEDSYN